MVRQQPNGARRLKQSDYKKRALIKALHNISNAAMSVCWECVRCRRTCCSESPSKHTQQIAESVQHTRRTGVLSGIRSVQRSTKRTFIQFRRR